MRHLGHCRYIEEQFYVASRGDYVFMPYLSLYASSFCNFVIPNGSRTAKKAAAANSTRLAGRAPRSPLPTVKRLIPPWKTSPSNIASYEFLKTSLLRSFCRSISSARTLSLKSPFSSLCGQPSERGQILFPVERSVQLTNLTLSRYPRP
jgi:hypothetical protein